MESEELGREARSLEKGEQVPEQQLTNENLLLFLDSLDGYITLMDSLSSTLRQGWLQLAGARHSMGTSRLNPALLDLNVRPAATSLQLHQREGEVDSIEIEKQPHFTLCRWVSSDNGKCSSKGEPAEEDKFLPQLRHRGNFLLSACLLTFSFSYLSEEEKTRHENRDSQIRDDQVQKERSKLLSMFGTLVSPKLRAAQLSFEEALYTLVEIANMRSSILYAFDQAEKGNRACEGL